MEHEQRDVRGHLAEAVRSLWFLRGAAPARFERIFPMTDMYLVVNLAARPYRVLDGADASWRTLGAGFSCGLRSRFVVSENPDPIINAGVVVRADGMRRLGLDPEALAGRVVSQPWLDDVAALGPDARGDEVLDALESVLAGRLRAGRVPDPVVRNAIAALERDPSQPIAPIAAACGLGHPSFVARFRRATGSTPKRYAELVRFHRLIDRMPVAATASWSDLAVEAGYYDQSHVIRDVKRFTGFTPADYHRRVSAAGADAVRFVPDPGAAFR
ncbi:helix-turn-helix domain-containing protein [Agromyces sp. NPDC058484]|uniref:helix-turn-helix domain-containing protein n=1 Tax=Agromyces sp. NPDC058484 TaxID=3346524 RepID=UPI0036660043